MTVKFLRKSATEFGIFLKGEVAELPLNYASGLIDLKLAVKTTEKPEERQTKPESNAEKRKKK